MVKAISILFLSVYLFTVVQVNELFKIPVMVEHFGEHQQNATRIGILEFIAIHYMNGEVYDDDFSRDMKLPFKSPITNGELSIVFCSVIPDYNFATSFFQIEFKPQKLTHVFSFSSKYRSTIWQPPQFS